MIEWLSMDRENIRPCIRDTPLGFILVNYIENEDEYDI